MAWARNWYERVGVCSNCDDLIPVDRPTRSLYCSNKCKQAAYRKRLAENSAKTKKKKRGAK